MRRSRVHPVAVEFPRVARSLPAAIVVVAILLATVACRRPPSTEELGAINDFQPLIDKFSPANSVVVVPDRLWETAADKGAWGFRGFANLLCYVEETSDLKLNIILEPTTATSDFHFIASWDGLKLWPQPRRLAALGEILEVPQDLLTNGLHRLEIRRVAAADDPEHQSQRYNGFSVIEYEVGEEMLRLLPDAADRYEFVRAFLEDGVTGVGEEKFSGWLANGNANATATITLVEDSVTSFRVASFDAGASRFTIAVDGDEHSVAVTSDTERLEFELSRGAHRLRWSVSGAEDGLYLWGAPHLRRAGPATAGPVILVTMDTTRWDSLSLYGGPLHASPNIARLASRATVFDNAWATSPWTLPSHASIFTGLYPSRHGAGVTKLRLVRQFTTLAEVYRRAGYRTAGFAGGEMSASYWGVAQGFEVYRDPEGHETRGGRLTGFVEEFLDSHGGEPFFLFVNYFDPHGLYQAPAAFEDLFGVAELREPIEDAPLWGDLSRGDGGAWREIISGQAEVTADAVAYLRAAYLAEVAFMDRQIGRLVEWLERNGLFDAATIVLVADHGEFLGEHGFFSHGCRLDPELTRVPLVIKWPHQTESDHVDLLVSQVDLFATLAAMAGRSFPGIDGISLESAHRREISQRHTVLMEEHEMRIHPLFKNMKIARSVIGVQKFSSRQVVWEGGTSCYRSTAAGWSEVRCGVDWQECLAQLEAVTILPTERSDDAGHDLSDDLRRRLEALGYVR
jgi:arylsulfatase A-like enzyme